MADLQRYERISRSFFPSTAFRQLRHGPRSDALFARCLVNACKTFGYVVCATNKSISLYAVATSRATTKQMLRLFVGLSLMASDDVMDAAAMRRVVDTADTGDPEARACLPFSLRRPGRVIPRAQRGDPETRVCVPFSLRRLGSVTPRAQRGERVRPQARRARLAREQAGRSPRGGPP